MKKMVNLYVPSLGACYDISVPDEMKVGLLVALLVRSVGELSYGRYVSSGAELLCREADGQTLCHSAALKEYGVGNGERLILF